MAAAAAAAGLAVSGAEAGCLGGCNHTRGRRAQVWTVRREAGAAGAAGGRAALTTPPRHRRVHQPLRQGTDRPWPRGWRMSPGSETPVGPGIYRLPRHRHAVQCCAVFPFRELIILARITSRLKACWRC